MTKRRSQPGAFSAYRWIALQNDRAGRGPLASYFKGEVLSGRDTDIFTSNMCTFSSLDLPYLSLTIACIDLAEDVRNFSFRGSAYGSYFFVANPLL
jgi:hypothetical protein